MNYRPPSASSSAPATVDLVTNGNIVTFLSGGTEQSRIDLNDPSTLEFEYMQQMNVIVENTWPEPQPLRAVHIGACGCALAWSWELRRPGSRQLAVEIDAALADLVRQTLPLPRKPLLRLRVGEGREVLMNSKASYQVIVRDAFSEAKVPPLFTTIEWAGIVNDHLQDGGLYLANIAHGGQTNGRGDVSSTLSVFPHAILVGDRKVLRGVRRGNLVLAAWKGSFVPDYDELDRRLRRLPLPVKIVPPNEVKKWLGGYPIVTDAALNLSVPEP